MNRFFGMLRLVFVFVVFASLQAIGNVALADGSISCTRDDVNWSSPFKNQKEFERFLPKSFDFPPPKARRFGHTKKDTAKRLNLSVWLPGNAFGLNWSLLDNGRLIADASGFAVRYKCSGGASDYRKLAAASEAKRGGTSQQAGPFIGINDDIICKHAVTTDKAGRVYWRTQNRYSQHIKEANRRGLTCGVGEVDSVQVASINASNLPACPLDKSAFRDNCFGTFAYASGHEYVGDFKDGKKHGKGTLTYANGHKYVGEFKDNVRHGKGILSFADGRAAKEGVWKDGIFQYAVKLIPIVTASEIESSTNNQASTAISEALIAAQQQADDERQKRLQAEAELAALKTKRQGQQQAIANDNEVPLIDIASVETVGKQGVIKGYITDNIGVAEVTVDGSAVQLTTTGTFEYSTFIPASGISVQIQATDLAGLTSVISVSLERSARTATASITFDRLNPLGRRVVANRNALALIVGVADYENTPAKAVFADSDALMFTDYASEKLGISESRIKTLVDDGADERQFLLGVKRWLARSVKQEHSDVYVFFAGHGLASDDGEKMYLLPYDGAPELLEDTAVSRDRLFSEIAAANPRSVTVFLDTCYSGTTRGPDMLIASRPIAIRAKEQAVPEGFTVMTAAAGDQTAKPLEEAKHGMFSYFLMKGMEGDADANQDNQITAGELHAYVQQNVIQQSSGSQTPELQGDADRVLVRFQ